MTAGAAQQRVVDAAGTAHATLATEPAARAAGTAVGEQQPRATAIAADPTYALTAGAAGAADAAITEQQARV
ncbi:hypothetical protein OSJ78_21440, partial [Mycobacterium ulcerans]